MLSLAGGWRRVNPAGPGRDRPPLRSVYRGAMADQPWVPTAEKIMIAIVVLCVLAMLVVIGMHLGIVPGCKSTHVC